MKGHDEVIARLNEVLTAEPTAINQQHFVHARMCGNWACERLTCPSSCGSTCTWSACP
jgi:bacterioferritin (cytochrome b1)